MDRTTTLPSQAVAAAAPWLRRHWRLLAAAACLLVATAVAALAIPVRQPATAGASQQPRVEDALAAAATAAEDLTPLLDSVRWGTSLREVLAAASQNAALAAESTPPAAIEQGAAALNQVRFVGYIAAPQRRAALLALPDGQVVRVAPGESLRDGRAVASVSDRSLTLTTLGDGEQVLPLFPPVYVPAPRSDADRSPESR